MKITRKSVHAEDLNMGEAPPQLNNPQEEIPHLEEAPEEDIEGFEMEDTFVDPDGFKRYSFKNGGWISFRKDFVFSTSIKRQREPLYKDLESSVGPPPAKKKKGKLPIQISKWAAEIISNCTGVGRLGLKRGSPLKPGKCVLDEICVFTNRDYVECSWGYTCILAEDEISDGTGVHSDDRLLIAVIELANIRGCLYMMLPVQESAVESTINKSVKQENQTLLDQTTNNDANEGDQTRDPVINSTQSSGTESIPEQMSESRENSGSYLGDYDEGDLEVPGEISQPPMLGRARNNFTVKIHQRLESIEKLLALPNSPSREDTFSDQRERELDSFRDFSSVHNFSLAKSSSTPLKNRETNCERGANASSGANAPSIANFLAMINTAPGANARPGADASSVLNVASVANTLSGANDCLGVNTHPVSSAPPDANAPSDDNASSGANTPPGANARPDADASSVLNVASVANALSGANASLGVNTPPVSSAPPDASAPSDDNASSGANASPIANVLAIINTPPGANARPGATAPPCPPTGKKPMKYWRQLAENDEELRLYLDKLHLWKLIVLYRPTWRNFSMPPPPAGYPGVPTADDFNEVKNEVKMRAEDMTTARKNNVRRAIHRLLRILPHRNPTKRDSRY